MKLRIVPITKILATVSIVVVTLAATGCADGRGVPTRPTAASTDATLAATGSIQLPLLLTKTCDAIDHCTVVTSPAGPLPVGSEAFYSGPLNETRTTSGVLIRTPQGDTAAGHCSLSYRSWVGTCTFTSGTGALSGFHANLKVSSDFVTDPAGVFTWDGTYRFTAN